MKARCMRYWLSSESLSIHSVQVEAMLAFIAYAVSLSATAVGVVMLFQTVVGFGPAERNALAAGQARAVPALVAKNAGSSASKSASKVVEPSKVAEPRKVKRVEATKPKRVTQSKSRPRVAQRRHDAGSGQTDSRAARRRPARPRARIRHHLSDGSHS